MYRYEAAWWTRLVWSIYSSLVLYVVQDNGWNVKKQSQKV